MISNKTLCRSLAAFMLAIAGGATLLVSTSADARPRHYFYQTYETKEPVRGYEGFLFPGSYCSYRRYPIRECTYNSRGREICKITGWRLEQTCS
jgi:hypothetical protein